MSASNPTHLPTITGITHTNLPIPNQQNPAPLVAQPHFEIRTNQIAHVQNDIPLSSSSSGNEERRRYQPRHKKKEPRKRLENQEGRNFEILANESHEHSDIETPLYEERSFSEGVLNLDDESAGSFNDGVLNLDERQGESSTTAEKESWEESCPICFVDYEEATELRILACTHSFHKKCIDPWILQQNNTCPLCRAKANMWATATINAS